VDLEYNPIPLTANKWTTVSGDTAVLNTGEGQWDFVRSAKRVTLSNNAGRQLCHMDRLSLDTGLGNPLTTLKVGDSGTIGQLLYTPETVPIQWTVVAT
jgi:hypothetical protein